jgi:hypothetical protein
MQLVVAKKRRNLGGSPSFSTVSVSSKPSRTLVAASAWPFRCSHVARAVSWRRALVALAAVGLVGAVGLGVVGVVVVSVQLAPLVAAGAFIVVAYNLELFGGRFHSDTWFALAWGAFPAFTSYWANALALRPAGVLVTAACFALSVAQRRLSTPARELRRRTVALRGEQQLGDGRRVELSAPALAAPLEGALSALSIAMVLLAAGFVAVRS